MKKITAASISFHGYVAVVVFYIEGKEGMNRYAYRVEASLGREVWKISRKKPGKALNICKKMGELMPVEIGVKL